MTVFLEFPTLGNTIHVRRDAIVAVRTGFSGTRTGAWLRLAGSGEGDSEIFVLRTPKEVLAAIDKSEPRA